MKKLLLLVLPFAGLFLFLKEKKYFDTPSVTHRAMPSGASEENGKLRRAWDRMRLADPLTGEIPKGITWLERHFAAQMSGVAERGGPDAANWQSRGPWNVGGRTRALAIDVTDSQHLFAGGVSGGIWESTDGGQSWQRRTPLNAHPGVVSIAQDTRTGHTNEWYYLSGEIFGTSASASGAFYLGDGMFKSVDNGQTWTPIGNTDNGSPQSFTDVWQSGWRVVTDPSAPDDQRELYVATYGVVWRSTDGGANWTAVRGSPNATQPSYFTDVTVTPSGVVYAALSSDGSQKGIWRSTDGTTWANITPSTGFPAEYDRWVISVNPNDANEVWILGATPGSGHYNNYIDSDDWTSLWRYRYLSGDGSGAGGQWADLSQNLPSTGTEFDQFACQGGYDLVVKVQPGTGHVFVGGTCLYRSTDAFATPNNTTQIGGYKIGTELPFFEIYPNHHPDVHDVLFLPENANVLFSASDGGVHRTDDAAAASVTWTALNRGYQTSQFYTAIFEKNTAGDNTLIGGLQDNGNFFVNTTDPNAIWRQTVNGDGAFGAIPAGKPFYVLSIQQGRLAKCDIDPMGNVIAFRRFDPIGPAKSDYLFINPLALDPTDQNTLYLPAGRFLYRQSDLAGIALTGEWDSIGQGWTRFPDSIPTIATGIGHVISAVGVSTANPAHRVYVGTSRNQLFKIDNAHTGTPNWTALPLPQSGNAGYIACIAVDPDNADDVLVLYSNYNIYSLFRSQNGGQTWQKVAGNLEQTFAGGATGPSLRWISILPFANGERRYFCGTSVGLYATDTLILHANNNPGTQWTLQAPDLIGSSVVGYVDTRAADGLVVAATHGIGMFSANFEAPSSTVGPRPVAASVRVSPNPTARRAAFFWLENASVARPVRVQLFDLNGKMVRNTAFSSGTQGEVDLGDLPVGTYLYRAEGAGWSKSGKVVKFE
jgi:photosystem II stability/assembly factor-like uncharacterized protein